eukprot:GAHX01000581.1.p1 GENE.GAHX01000581.1~~GAHX01000581.1.p1  ORF type:complete len:604 (-),score=122.63 GAHX01000581.1:48-1859(-)
MKSSSGRAILRTILFYVLITFTKEVKIRVINLNIASQEFTRQTFQDLYDDSTSTLFGENAANDAPEIIIVALQEVSFFYIHKNPLTDLGRAMLTDQGARKFIDGFKLVKSGGSAMTKFFIFESESIQAGISVDYVPEVLKYYKTKPVKNHFAQKGATATTLRVNHVSIQLVSTHMPARFKGLMKRISTFEKMYSKLGMNGPNHVQIVTGDLNSRTDLENYELLVRGKLSDFHDTYKNDDRIAKEIREASNMEMLKSRFRKFAEEHKDLRLGLSDPKDLTFQTLKRREIIDFLLDHDQLKICMKRNIMFDAFEEGIIVGAPSYRLNNGKTKKVQKLLGYEKEQKYKRKLFDNGHDNPYRKVLEDRNVYFGSQTVSYPDRVLLKVLPGVRDLVIVGNIHTFVFEGIKTDHAALTTEITLKDELFTEDHSTKLSDAVKDKMFVLKLKEKFPGVIVEPKPMEGGFEQSKLNEKNKLLRQDRKTIKVSKISLVKGEQEWDIWEESNDGSTDEIEDSDENPSTRPTELEWKSKAFKLDEALDESSGIVTFKVLGEVNGQSQTVIVNMWLYEEQVRTTTNKDSEEGSIVSIGLGISEMGHWIFDAELFIE